jgi:chromosome segregation ATPase
MIVDHVATPLDFDQVEQACKDLNRVADMEARVCDFPEGLCTCIKGPAGHRHPEDIERVTELERHAEDVEESSKQAQERIDAAARLLEAMTGALREGEDLESLVTVVGQQLLTQDKRIGGLHENLVAAHKVIGAAAKALADLTGTDHDLAELESQVDVAGRLLRMRDERIEELLEEAKTKKGE